MPFSHPDYEHNQTWRSLFDTDDDAARVKQRIEQQFATAKAEGHHSYLEGVIDRCIAVATDTTDPQRAADYKDALQGDHGFISRIENMMDKAYVDDIIELYFVATSQFSLFPIFRDCQAMMDDPTQRAKAATILQHVAPIAAKRQPAVLLTFAPLLLTPNETGERPLLLEKTAQCLHKAVARSSAHDRPSLSLRRHTTQPFDDSAKAVLKEAITQAEALEKSRGQAFAR